MDEKSKKKISSFEHRKTINQPVILSGENCEAICVVELLRVERSEQAKARCVAPQGYGLKFR